MHVRLLIAAPDLESLDLYQALFTSALRLLPLDISAEYAASRDELVERVGAHQCDVVLLDWEIAGPATPDFLHRLAEAHRGLRTIVVMPLQLRQYRQCLWEAGVCVGLPKEHLDQEWLLSMLCLITRAMEREAAAHA